MSLAIFLTLFGITHADSSSVLTQWTNYSVPALPRKDQQLAVGYYNDSIYIFGGQSYPHSMVRYDILSDSMIDYGENYTRDVLGNDEGDQGCNSHFTQIGNTLYMLSWLNRGT